MNITKISAALLATAAVASFSAHANLIDFTSSWPGAFTGQGLGAFANAPYDRVLEARKGAAADSFSTTTQIAALLNDVLGTTTWTKDDVNKYAKPAEIGTSVGGKIDGYFEVPAGWDYLIVQYDGKNGGSVVIELDGNSAKVPYDSAPIWGTGDQYAISHYSLVSQVPDGGSTLTLLGASLLALAFVRRK